MRQMRNKAFLGGGKRLMDIFDKYDFSEDRLSPRYNDRERMGNYDLIQHYDGVSTADR